MNLEQKIPDKQWLDRVHFAYYTVYQKQNPSQEIESFISWLYSQYGIIEPKDRVKPK